MNNLYHLYVQLAPVQQLIVTKEEIYKPIWYTELLATQYVLSFDFF